MASNCGLPPPGSAAEAIAKGQFYEVSCLGFTELRSVVGWQTEPTGGLVNMIDKHPTWHSPWVRDLRTGVGGDPRGKE